MSNGTCPAPIADGVAIEQYGSILYLSNSRLLGNSAGYGSGVHAYDVFSGTNPLLSGNTAWVGGALF